MVFDESQLWQWLVLLPVLLWSVWRVLGRLLPRTRQKLHWACVHGLARLGLRRLAARLQPAPLADAPCGSGCGGCDTGCATPKPAVPEQPVQWR